MLADSKTKDASKTCNSDNRPPRHPPHSKPQLPERVTCEKPRKYWDMCWNLWRISFREMSAQKHHIMNQNCMDSIWCAMARRYSIVPLFWWQCSGPILGQRYTSLKYGNGVGAFWEMVPKNFTTPYIVECGTKYSMYYKLLRNAAMLSGMNYNVHIVWLVITVMSAT